MSISPIDYLRYTWQMLNGFRVYAERSIAERRHRDTAPYMGSCQPLRILDVANGRLRPQYALLKAAGHHVYGIDLINRSQRSRVDLAYKIARRLYAWKLGLPSESRDTCTLVCGDVGRLPFPDAAFDMVTSVAAFEHFLDVPTVVSEIHRVLRLGGLVWVLIHLFTCPTGGHNLSFTQFPLRSVPAGVEPWDHLRQRKLPLFVPLNEWRKHQYLEAFARHFEVVADRCAMREGEELLTPEVESALAGYSRDELTCSAYVIVARKRL